MNKLLIGLTILSSMSSFAKIDGNALDAMNSYVGFYKQVGDNEKCHENFNLVLKHVQGEKYLLLEGDYNELAFIFPNEGEEFLTYFNPDIFAINKITREVTYDEKTNVFLRVESKSVRTKRDSPFLSRRNHNGIYKQVYKRTSKLSQDKNQQPLLKDTKVFKSSDKQNVSCKYKRVK